MPRGDPSSANERPSRGGNKAKDVLFLGGIVLGAALFVGASPEQLSSLPTLCLVRQLTGMECPGCGMLRAFNSLAQGELARAVRFNAMVIVVAPLVGYLTLRRAGAAVRALSSRL